VVQFSGSTIGGRIYGPDFGKFYSVDPLGLDPDADPFRYTHNNPTDYTDPSGLEIEDDGQSCMQYITTDKMDDLVKNNWAHEVDGLGDDDSHRVIIMPYGTEIRGFDYTLHTNPTRGGRREWGLVRTAGLGDIANAGIASSLKGLDRYEVAKRFAKQGVDDRTLAAQQKILNFSILAMSMVPAVGTAEALARGDTVDAAISFLGDVTLGAGWLAKADAKAAKLAKGGQAAARLANANTGLLVFQATQGVIAVTRIGQAGYAVVNGEGGKAAAYFGEALLRILGVRYTVRVAPAK
jgi:hypothetical protein